MPILIVGDVAINTDSVAAAFYTPAKPDKPAKLKVILMARTPRKVELTDATPRITNVEHRFREADAVEMWAKLGHAADDRAWITQRA